MAELTKEWLLKTIAELEEERDATPGAVNEDAAMALAAMKIALASLEAEPVCVIDQSNLDYLNAGSDADVWPVSRTEMGDVLLYRTAPPAPANAEPVAWLWSHRKHPSEVSLVRPEDDEMADGSGWSGWSCQALYAAQPAPVSVPDIATVETTYPDVQTNWQDAKMYAEGWNACRSAMLQGADGTLTNEGTIPVTQFKPVVDLYGLTSPTGGETSFTFDAVEARDFIDGGWSCQEYVELERFQEAVSGNSPVIPDGWVACSERMPDKGQNVLISVNFDSPLIEPLICSARYTGSTFRRGDVTVKPGEGVEEVTHWMPLPAAPQQEA